MLARGNVDSDVIWRGSGRSGSVVCVFRRNQPLFPIQTSRLFRVKPAGHSDDPSRVDGAVCERVKLAYGAAASSSLALAARSLRMLSPLRSRRCAPCTSLSSTASAMVGASSSRGTRW